MNQKFDFKRFMQPFIRDLTPYSGIDPLPYLAEYANVPVDKIIKLDGNENPYGPSPKVAEALGKNSWHHLYPDPQQREARAALAAYSGTNPDSIVAGSGSDELIDLFVRLFIRPGDKIINLPPTFGMYAVSAKSQGGIIVNIPRDEHFEVDVSTVINNIEDNTRLLFLTNPNNPTGTLTHEDSIRSLLDAGLIVIVDETYHEFCGYTVAHLIPEYDNLIILRTFSKWAGIAGLRLGYGIMSPAIARYLMAIKLPYNISVAAELALHASLDDTDLLLERVRDLVEERERMSKLLKDIPGIFCYPSKGNFVLCEFEMMTAQSIYEKLAAQGIFVRKFDDPRLINCLRISAGKPEQTDVLFNALKEIVRDRI